MFLSIIVKNPWTRCVCEYNQVKNPRTRVCEYNSEEPMDTLPF